MKINCENCRGEIEDYLSGELDHGTAASVRAHLETCQVCSAARDEIERENALYAGFYEQTSIEPSVESWDAVRDRIRGESLPVPSEPGRSFLAGLVAWVARPVVLQQAAFAIVLVALSVAATLYFTRRQTPTVPPETSLAKSRTPENVAPVSSPTPVVAEVKTEVRTEIKRPVRPPSESDLLAAQVARAEREYLSAIRLLDRAIARRRNELDPAVVQQYEASLALIDQSIEASRNAFRQNRNDLNASQFLIAAYSRKVELMQDIAMR